MRIVNKRKFITRIVEIIIAIVTWVTTTKAIAYATALRGYKAYGGEYLLPILGLLAILILETILEENSRR
mgnify:CR=1 FL=1